MESHPSVATKPIAPYIGGKRILAKRVIARIEAIPHTLYAEPFVGMGGVFLRRPTPAKVEVINDLSSDVANLFRILQRHIEAFIGELEFKITSRQHFDRLIATDPETLTDLERAARFLYVQRLAFGGKVNGRNFGVSRDTPARFDVGKLRPMLVEMHERLASVVIEQLPYAAFMKRYDRPGALFYLDPPYFGCETDYGNGMFSRPDFQRLADQLASIKGRFILSLNDRPEVWEIFDRFTIEAVDTSYRISGASQKVSEVLISSS
jgi:DNA adenine methylase